MARKNNGEELPLARLATSVGEKIRAGRNVSSFAQAVEELVSNAIDAEANAIQVTVDVRKGFIAVRDNGCGMSREELAWAGASFSTSKLSPQNNKALLKCGIVEAASRGFRGDAIFALSHLASVQIWTRPWQLSGARVPSRLSKSLVSSSSNSSLSNPSKLDSSSQTAAKISSVSPMTVWTKTIRLGKSSDVREDSHAESMTPGTTVCLQEIFQDVPVRRARLQTQTKETLLQVRRLLERNALGSPHCSFVLRGGSNVEFDTPVLWRSPGGQSTRELFGKLFGETLGQNLLDRSLTSYGIELEALVSPPHIEEMQSSAQLQFIFVNGRPLPRVRRIEGLMNRLYRNYFDRTDSALNTSSGPYFPAFVLVMQCDPAMVDILWEPSKAIVEFADWPRIMDAVQELMRGVFEDESSAELDALGAGDNSQDSFVSHATSASSHSRYFQQADEPSDRRRRTEPIASNRRSLTDENMEKEPAEKTLSCKRPWKSTETHHSSLDEKGQRAEAEESHNPPDPPSTNLDNDGNSFVQTGSSEEDAWRTFQIKRRRITDQQADRASHVEFSASRVIEGVSLTREALASCRVIAQVGAKFIFVQNDSQVFCIDQHAADERIRLEEFEDDLKDGQESSYLKKFELERREAVRLMPDQQELLQSIRAKLELWGYTWRACPWSSNEIELTSVPAIFGVPLGGSSLIDILEFAKESPSLIDLLLPPPIRNAAVNRACRGAIKFGDDLSHEQCVRLIRKLSRCKFPFQCAHGRPSCVPIADIVNQEYGQQL